MSDSESVTTDPADSFPQTSENLRPEELPPVEPPSAGYIIQLFLIPALIVAAVIGVWALFGKLADSETDWKQLVAELGSANEHRRWRAALGLAQVLNNQQMSADADGVVLAKQPEVANALTSLLRESLDSNSTLDEDIKHQEFLARTLGTLKADEVVLPALADALTPDRNIEVRKSSLMSLAMIAGRHFEDIAQGAAGSTSNSGTEGDFALDQPLSSPTIDSEAVLAQLKLAAQDEEPSIRHLAAYVLALMSGPEAIETLKVILLDGDPMARANAAVGLARNGLTDGVPTLIELLQEDQPVILRNCIRAAGSLWPKLSGEQQEQLSSIVNTLAKSHEAADVRMEAKSLISRNLQ